MANFCKNCGKPFSFFKSIFSSICDECKEKMSDNNVKYENIPHQSVIDNNPINCEDIQQQIETFQPLIDNNQLPCEDTLQNIVTYQPMIENSQLPIEDTPQNLAAYQPASNATQQNNENIAGEIAYYGLQEWWINDLTAKERDKIISTYKPLGFGGSNYSLVEGSVTHSDRSVIAFLTGLSSWFQNKEHRKIGSKIIKKIESIEKLSSDKTPIMDKHFSYMMAIKRYYSDRDIDENALPSAIEACYQQIAISGLAKKAFLKEYKGSPLPSHTGYKQLCIIMEKQKKIDEVIRLATIAKEQGWNGDWDIRIERCTKKKGISVK